MTEIDERLRRLYAAVGETLELDLSKFPPSIPTPPRRGLVFSQDFRGGMSDAQIANFAHTAIHAVAHLGDHLRRFARQADLNPDDVDSTIEGSQELKVLIDLSNNDKHGYPPRDGGKSGISPRVLKFRRSLRVSTGPGEGETVGVVLTANGPVLEGSGSAAVVITGEVVDKKGSVVGHVDKYLEAAAAQWEALLKKWKVSV